MAHRQRNSCETTDLKHPKGQVVHVKENGQAIATELNYSNIQLLTVDG
ncbi:hypothetical protein H6G72_28455 [Planktothricoides sp. FACHB-1370]|uniref:Transposase n=1 Tax=Planktothricoides raciborskii FACHB-1370 TaxID=2949576 RepID=A0ABR8ELB9_9CYAN|nr:MULTISPECIES: hypothetical protein [Planktothricoides]MBD2547684.1 hypothetical protein [Planktothricoides raciborskii FACHB-1370]MBD2586123.1 hypothetical protein [Planktothricoides raciborskii FACHB-1261]